MAKIGLIGAGSWGTALSKLAADNGHEVTVWSIVKEEIEMLRENREHLDKLPGVKLPENISYTTELSEAIEGMDLCILAVPSPFTRNTAAMMKPFVGERQIIVNVAKGVEEKTLMTLSEIIEEEIPQADVAVLSGPSHAEEVGRQQPTGVVAACADLSAAELVQEAFMCRYFRVYTNTDILGVELGGALKNVIALSCGVTDGIGLGDNTKALLMTRGMTEMARLGVALGGRSDTFAGLSGMGDLIVTCTSMHSRNRRAGILVGMGCSAAEAMEQVGAVVEGYYAAKSACELAKKAGVEMPICRAAHQVLYEGKSVHLVVDELMNRDRKHEVDESWI